MMISFSVCSMANNRAIQDFIAVTPLKSWIARLFAMLHTLKEIIIGPFETHDHILQYMRSNLLVFWPKLLDVYQFAFLLVVAHRVFTGQLLAAFFVIVTRMTPHPHLVGVAALLEAGIVEFPAAIKHPLQFFSCSFVRIDT